MVGGRASCSTRVTLCNRGRRVRRRWLWLCGSSQRPGVPTMLHSRLLADVKGRLRIRSHLARQCLAEFLGVFVRMLLTQGAGAQAVTSGETKGNFFTMFLAGSLAVTIAIYVGGNVSGAHLNPAFSLAMCLLGRLPWARLPIYCLVQLLSAFCASGATYAVYYDALQNHTGGNLTVTGPKETASLFATYPAPYLSLNNGFLDQVLGTGVLIVGILAILGTRNKGVPAGLEPVAVGLAPGANCGFPLNPARDLGPRLFTYVAGRGPEVFSRGCVLRHVCPVTFWHCDRITRWVYSENSLRQEAGPSSPGVSSLTAVICCQDLVFPAASIPPGAALGRFSCYRPWSFRERLEDSP
ncbi:aquaporin-10 isoform X2 [Lynx canadensis]|uniref:aquaporin-10 isoform X2 n=1 Tax=Lynx canadensis TaxID=61383 RepID=UPI0013C42056|nr:aquaporin-10 isoform X2 [Lynx canadensis]